MVEAGIDDVCSRTTSSAGASSSSSALLLRRADVKVTADDERLLPGLAGAAADAGRELPVLVDCDTGFGRTGVGSPEDAAALGAAIERTEGLSLAGMLTFPTPPGTRESFSAACALLERQGLAAATVSAGGTPTMWSAAELAPVATEYRAGTYVFNDRNTLAAGAADYDDVALTIVATVVSRRDGRAILDAGSKALSSDTAVEGGFGHVLEAPASTLEQLNEEHGYLALGGADDLSSASRSHRPEPCLRRRQPLRPA